MSQAETWTVGRLLTWTTDYLKQRGADNPRLDAEVLLAHSRGCERIRLYTAFDEEVPDDVRGRFRDLVKQRAAGTPVAYLVGHREFYSLDFRVTPDVLIPRPETELAVVTVLDLLKEHGVAEPRIVDVGTGSGAIAVALAVHAPKSRVTATDLSPTALAIARENAHTHGVAERIEFVEGDLLTPLPAEPMFDAVVSNPPYVSQPEYDVLPTEIKGHEPRMALLGGETGCEVVGRLIPQAAERLLPDGHLVMEFSPMVEQEVFRLLNTDDRFTDVRTLKDLASLGRLVVARRVA
ncbi:MAG: peptide chain release factor N(5)-glutamine methyltransferase [Pirellulaceae bacterium]